MGILRTLAAKGGTVTNRTLTAVCLLIVAIAASAVAYDRSEFLFLDEIEIGMVGVGRTIVAGDAIEEFSVEVLGIIDQAGTLNDFIVVRVSGEAIGRSGGIAKGMSGSPVFVDGKLIGAVSRAASWSKELTPIGLVTPIEPMLAVLDSASSNLAMRQPSEQAVLAAVRIADADSTFASDMLDGVEDTIFAQPVSTPLVVSGLSGRSLDVLMGGASSQSAPSGLVTEYLKGGLVLDVQGFTSLGLSLLPMSGSDTGSVDIDPASLEPGSSIGVALATGDISAGSLGTLTYRDGDALVGYGHPFVSHGASRFALTTVSIIDTMKTFDASFKLGTLGDTIGTIFEDRIAAVGGGIGPMPDMIGLSIKVDDLDRNESTSYSIDIVNEPQLIPELLLSTGFEAIDTTLDRVGPGTVEVVYHVTGAGMPHPLERRDIFLHSADVAVYPPWQLASLVSYLQYNSYEEPQIDHIAMSVQVTEDLNAVMINGLRIDSYAYYPGDTIHYSLELQTFQGESWIEEGEIIIPDDLVSDYIFIRAYGGARTYEDGETAPDFQSLADVVDAIESLPSNDVATVELFAVDPFSPIDGALYGVDEKTYEISGYAVLDEREVYAALLDPSTRPTNEPKPSPDW